MYYCEICGDWMDCWNDCENCDVYREWCDMLREWEAQNIRKEVTQI